MHAIQVLRWAGGAILLGALAGLAVVAGAAAAPTSGQIVDAPPGQRAGAPAGGATLTTTPTPIACAVSYTYTVSAGSFITATDLLAGSQCWSCLVSLSLPFPITFYGQTYTGATVSTEGNVQFAGADTSAESCPPPYPQLGPALLPYWFSGADTSWNGPCEAVYRLPCGIFTRLTGSAPARNFTLEWRAGWAGSNHEAVNYEVRFHENSDIIDFVYGGGIQFGDGTSSGIQDGGTRFTSYGCNVTRNYEYLTLSWLPQYPPSCVLTATPSATVLPTQTATPTPRATNTAPTATPTQTALPTQPPTGTGTPAPGVTGTPTNALTTTRTPTATPLAGGTLTPTRTATPCTMPFTDVRPADYFAPAVTYLYCHAVISGYGDNTFRPFTSTTRGQMAKIAMLGFGIAIWTPAPGTTPTFQDVPRSNPFFAYVETAAHNQIISGYGDGTYRPFANVTRGQLAKILVIAATAVYHWALLNPPAATFTDVPSASPFYPYVETAYCHGIISGYGDGTFRPGNSATRGQIAKIAYLAILDQGACD